MDGKKHIETLYFEDDSSVSSDIFKNLFYGHTILRPCCYQCPYKSIQHPGDITIADYWGIEKAAPGFSDNKGGSLVLINNERGEELFEKVKNGLICEKPEWKIVCSHLLRSLFRNLPIESNFGMIFIIKNFVLLQ